MHNFSYWEKTSFFQDVDFLIVGSGLVGLNTAITLKQQYPKARVLILERGILPTGASTKNAGFACIGSASEIIADLQQHPAHSVWQLVAQRYEGLNRLRQRLGDSILDFESKGNYEIFTQAQGELFEKCLAEMPYLNQQLSHTIGKRDVFKEKTRFDIQSLGLNPDKIQGLIWNKAEGSLNTGKMMQALLQMAYHLKVEILNGITVTGIEEIENHAIVISHEIPKILAKQVIIATNAFAKDLLPQLPIVAVRNQVFVTSAIKDLKIKGCFHSEQGYIYFRNLPDNRLLIGGARHKALVAETTAAFGENPFLEDYLYDFLKKEILPEHTAFTFEHKWSGILGMGESKMPIIKRHSPHITVAARLGGMGVAIGILIAEKAASIALENIEI